MYETEEPGPRVGRGMPWEFTACMLHVQAKRFQSVGNTGVTSLVLANSAVLAWPVLACL